MDDRETAQVQYLHLCVEIERTMSEIVERKRRPLTMLASALARGGRSPQRSAGRFQYKVRLGVDETRRTEWENGDGIRAREQPERNATSSAGPNSPGRNEKKHNGRIARKQGPEQSLNASE